MLSASPGPGTFAAVMAFVTVVNYGIARWQGRREQVSRRLLWAGIGFNILTLVVFRLGDFFVPNLQAFLDGLGLGSELGALQIILPVGLSFYALQNVSYQVDIYRRQIKPVADFVAFSLYQAYFPKLLAGPIERASAFLPRLARQRMVDNEVLARSVTLVAVGAFRKVIIADTLATAMPWDLFVAPANFSSYELWLWLFVYGFALYNDFAGYTSIVQGISGLFGIELSANFRQPYFSRSFGEFWNSWHISLSHWLRDYIYFPTLRVLLRRNGGRADRLTIIVPPLLTMVASAAWHGFSLHLLLWGALHGLYQVVERALALRGKVVPADRRPRWRQLAAMSVVFLLVMWAWVPFRAELPVALQFWRQLLTLGPPGLRYRRLALVAVYVLAAVALDNLQYQARDDALFLRWPRPARAFLLATVTFLLWVVSFGAATEPFVYQGF
jgi:D-alanyl-lipoteichoic acid acyltransferase DltB (MBOAT superfamily)